MAKLVEPLLPPGRICARPQPTLVAEDLVIRPWLDKDADALVTAYSDPAIRQWHARSMTPDEVPGWIAERRQRWLDEAGGDWAVEQSGAVVGRASIGSFDLAEGIAEVGYWTLPAARGRAIAARSLHRLSSWAFEDLGLHRLELHHAVANRASCRVADKAGFAMEGICRQQLRHADGWQDMHQHSRLASDPAQ